ncbi:MAG: T9SS type A sorting domain-containing protein [Saprospiraceae bacterium]|nr:T9SS type A sorting domain-containing protein [Saprospiraceae bacterium]MBK8111787.1 T9SS type A sorting domain-containing protein [Saprospiraceae bacterium]
MRFSSTLIIALACIHTLFGQIKVAQHVLSSGGSQAKTGNISASGTLGETFIFGGKNANYFYCQGFQSGNEATITAVFDTEIQALHLSYYPNPSHDFIQIQWEKKGLISRFLLLDEKGALIHKFQINSNDNAQILDLRDLMSGKYILQYVDFNNQTRAAGWILFTR